MQMRPPSACTARVIFRCRATCHGIDSRPESRRRPRHDIARAIDPCQMSGTRDQGRERDAAAEPDLGDAIQGLHVEQFQRKSIHPAVVPVHQAANKTTEKTAWMSEMASDQARRSHELS